MHRLTITAGLLITVLAAPAGTQPHTAPTSVGARGQVFRSGVDLITLTVSVVDRAQRYVADLEKDDFAVYEDGIPQAVAFFAADRVPLDLAIVLDASASMRPRSRAVHDAAVGLARTLRPGDRGTIIAFADTVRVRQGLTGDLTLLEPAIRQAGGGGGGTALYMAVYVILDDLTRQRAKNGEVRRQALVVLSDGLDTRSLVAPDDVLDVGRRGGIGIYTISLGKEYAAQDPSSTPTRNFSVFDFTMRSLAHESGGRWFAPITSRQLAATYRDVAEELANQYSLGYVSTTPRRDDSFRRVVVRVPTRPDAHSRTRAGYFARDASAPGSR